MLKPLKVNECPLFAFKLLFCTGACKAIDIQSSERSVYAYGGKEGGRGEEREGERLL